MPSQITCMDSMSTTTLFMHLLLLLVILGMEVVKLSIYIITIVKALAAIWTTGKYIVKGTNAVYFAYRIVTYEAQTSRTTHRCARCLSREDVEDEEEVEKLIMLDQDVIVKEEDAGQIVETSKEAPSQDATPIAPAPVKAKATRTKRFASAEAPGVRKSLRLQLRQAGTSGPATRSRYNSAPAPTSSNTAHSSTTSSRSTTPPSRSSKSSSKNQSQTSRGKHSKSH